MIFIQGFFYGSCGSSWTISHDATTRWVSMQIRKANFNVKKRRKNYDQGATIFKYCISNFSAAAFLVAWHAWKREIEKDSKQT